VIEQKSYQPKLAGDLEEDPRGHRPDGRRQAPIFYSGGGVINSGPEASKLLRELVELTGFPITSTLMGLGAYPASARTGWACWACTAPMKPTWRCMTAMS
jgi:acetolactate synthase-1/2/3 large subunit